MLNFNEKKYLNCFGNLLRYLRIIYLRAKGVTIGEKCFISFHAKLDSFRGKIIIGDRCDITHGCVILSHDASVRKRTKVGTTCIGNNVLIGVNSVVLCNVTIGDNSVIGAGSVVTKDIPPNVVAVGKPARVIRELSEN